MGHEGNKINHLGHQAHLAHNFIHLYEHVELFGGGEKAKELSEIVKQHALTATGIAFIPVPVLDVAAMVGNTWAMYARINSALGISFGENVLKSIASGILGNLVSTLPAAALGVLAASALKFLPGMGTVGGIAVGAATNIAVLFVAGKVYIKSLEALLRTGRPLTAENIQQAASEVTKDKTFVKSAYQEGKDTAKSRPPATGNDDTRPATL